MQEGIFLYFIPPLLSGGETGKKARYMLVVEYSKSDNIVKMINVSSLKGKEHNLLYSSNIEIINYKPLKVPTFAKVNTLYTIDYFKDLEKYIAFEGQTLEEEQFIYIDKYRLNYMREKKTEILQYTENEFKKINK